MNDGYQKRPDNKAITISLVGIGIALVVNFVTLAYSYGRLEERVDRLSQDNKATSLMIERMARIEVQVQVIKDTVTELREAQKVVNETNPKERHH